MPEQSPSHSPFITRPIDNTALDAYMACPRRYYYGMVLNRRKRGALSPALAYGSVWHKILETHYKTGGNRELVEFVAHEAWQAPENPDDHRTVARALLEYDNYLKEWGEHDEEAARWGKTVGYPTTPMVEISTEVSWPGARHPYTGKIDRIVESQGLYMVEDHKTTARFDLHYFSQFDPSNQMMGYAWLAGLITGLPISGVRINAHVIHKKDSLFERQVIMFSTDRLQEWTETYNEWTRRIEVSMELRTAQRPLSESFPQNFNACAGKYGHCQYADVCTMRAGLRDRVLESQYEENPWNPLAVEEATDAAE